MKNTFGRLCTYIEGKMLLCSIIGSTPHVTGSINKDNLY